MHFLLPCNRSPKFACSKQDAFLNPVVLWRQMSGQAHLGSLLRVLYNQNQVLVGQGCDLKSGKVPTSSSHRLQTNLDQSCPQGRFQLEPALLYCQASRGASSHCRASNLTSFPSTTENSFLVESPSR